MTYQARKSVTHISFGVMKSREEYFVAAMLAKIKKPRKDFPAPANFIKTCHNLFGA